LASGACLHGLVWTNALCFTLRPFVLDESY
jgi:hypothetical protein